MSKGGQTSNPSTEDPKLECHPYNLKENIPAATRILIIGTAPPPRFQNFQERNDSYDFDFFYGSEFNYMWPILEQALKGQKILSDETSSDDCVKAAKTLLLQEGLWMRDVLQIYSRRCANSASDDNITPIEFTCFKSTLSQGPNISNFVFTSERAASWTMTAIDEKKLSSNIGECRQNFINWREQKCDASESRRSFLLRKHTTSFTICKFDGRDVSFFIAPTPSPRGIDLETKKEIYKKLLSEARRSIQ